MAHRLEVVATTRWDRGDEEGRWWEWQCITAGERGRTPTLTWRDGIHKMMELLFCPQIFRSNEDCKYNLEKSGQMGVPLGKVFFPWPRMYKWDKMGLSLDMP
jgi:hypothetical protein